MVLKNKDGSPYLLAKPNPLMINQEFWQDAKLVFHNKIGTIFTMPDETKSKKVIVPLKKEKIEETPVVEESDKVQVWCLPASYKEYRDNLYGENYRKVRYGNKFILEVVILVQEDLSITMWTDTKAVTEGSVLFPRTDDKRWWRVERIQEQDGGYVIYSIISDYQPKFSD